MDFPKKLSELETSQSKKDKTIKKNKKTSDQTKSQNQGKQVTSIETQKRPGRYNIYLDGDYAFAVDEQVLIDFMLSKGMFLDEKKIRDIQAADSQQKAYQASLNYLSYQLRSEAEVRDKLDELEGEVDQDAIIDKLKGLKLIDDLNFSESFVRTKARINQMGPRQIAQKLREKGVEQADIEQALKEYREEDQLDNAFLLAEKQLRKGKKYSSRQAQQKAQQFLMQKGFSKEVIERAMQQVDFDKDEDEERRALEKHGRKAWRRYSKQGLSACKKKTYANLYQKGFPSDLISDFISEMEEEWEFGSEDV